MTVRPRGGPARRDRAAAIRLDPASGRPWCGRSGVAAMCGIVGQARGDGGTPERALLESMCAALEHRGPDSRGVHAEPGAGSGFSACGSSTW